VLNAAWDAGTLISNVETVNLEYLSLGGFAMSSILPGTDLLNVSGLTGTGTITNVISGTAFGIGSTYASLIDIDAGNLAALTLNLNGGGSSIARATFDIEDTDLITALTVNANASTSVNLNTNAVEFAGIALAGAGNVTIFDASANIIDANITAPALTYTGVFTLRPTDTSAVAAYDFTEATQDVVGLDVFDMSTADGLATGTTITMPTVTTGGSLTVTHAPAASAPLGSGANAADLTIVQSGASTADAVTLSLGANSTGTLLGDIVASNTDTFTISSAAATASTTTIDDITIASGAGTQSIIVSGAGGFSLGDLNAEIVSTAGVVGAVSITSLTNAVGSTTFTGGAGATTISAAGAANVSVTTGIGADNITTGAGDDEINVGNGVNTVVSAGGTDTIVGGNGVDTITSGTGADIVTPGLGADSIITTTGVA
jgi:hypothetical protein